MARTKPGTPNLRHLRVLLLTSLLVLLLMTSLPLRMLLLLLTLLPTFVLRLTFLLLWVGRCRLTLSKPVLKTSPVSALETQMRLTAFKRCFQCQLAPLHLDQFACPRRCLPASMLMRHVADLEACCPRVEIPEDGKLYSEGHQADAMLLVLRGTVRADAVPWPKGNGARGPPAHAPVLIGGSAFLTRSARQESLCCVGDGRGGDSGGGGRGVFNGHLTPL